MEGLDSQTTSHILLELSAYEAGTEFQVLASFRILLGFPVYGGEGKHYDYNDYTVCMVKK